MQQEQTILKRERTLAGWNRRNFATLVTNPVPPYPEDNGTQQGAGRKVHYRPPSGFFFKIHQQPSK